MRDLVRNLVLNDENLLLSPRRNTVDIFKDVAKGDAVRRFWIPIPGVQPSDVQTLDEKSPRRDSGDTFQGTTIDRCRGTMLPSNRLPKPTAGHDLVAVKLCLGRYSEALGVVARKCERRLDGLKLILIDNIGAHVVSVLRIGLVDEGVEHTSLLPEPTTRTPKRSPTLRGIVRYRVVRIG